MSMPVKLSDELVLSARREAALTERSITAQIEYWAKLGRALERALSHEEVLAINATHGDLRQAFVAPERQRSVRAVMQAILATDERNTVQAIIHASKQPVYETDPQRVGGIVQVSADGKRIAGRFVQRRFVPDKAASPKAPKRAKTKVSPAT